MLRSSTGCYGRQAECGFTERWKRQPLWHPRTPFGRWEGHFCHCCRRLRTKCIWMLNCCLNQYVWTHSEYFTWEAHWIGKEWRDFVFQHISQSKLKWFFFLNKQEKGALPISKYDIPKELWFLVDRLYKTGMDKESLFSQSGLTTEILQIRDWLDEIPNTPIRTSGYFFANCLELFNFIQLYSKLICSGEFRLCSRGLGDSPGLFSGTNHTLRLPLKVYGCILQFYELQAGTSCRRILLWGSGEI